MLLKILFITAINILYLLVKYKQIYKLMFKLRKYNIFLIN